MKCPWCAIECAEASNYCSGCGTRLRFSLRERGPAGDSRSVRERRQLTVMFCDLVGSTKLSLTLDAEDFTSVVSAYRDECVRIVRQRKGQVVRYVGDGVLIYFGYPRAAEDDALRGVAAAWELAHAIPNLRLPQSPASGRPAWMPILQARISLHTGLAIVGDVVGLESLESDGALGAVPNVAARLQSLAGPGQVVISEATAALLPASIELQPLQTATRSADLEGVRAFTLVSVPQDLVRRRAASTCTLVGRSDLLDSLRAQLDQTTGGVGGLLLCGEPGIGKSRLVRELVAHRCAVPTEWIELACSAYGQLSPLHPFRDLLGTAPADALGDSQPARLTSPYEQRRRIFDRLRAALLERGLRAGLVIEDIHWADSTTLELVSELLLSPAADRLFLVMTSRERPPDALQATRRLRVETLSRLLPGDAVALARDLCVAQPLTAFELAEIVSHADGVPLFIEEFIRAASDAGPDRIPITLRDSLMGILDNLGTGRSVALCASVFGRRFKYVHLRELTSLSDEVLAPAVQALTKAQVLLQTGEIPQASLEFRHALLRDIAYHTMLKSERRRWHLRVAEMATAGTPGIEDSMPELLALHHSLGGSHKSAIGFWLHAQARAMERSANVEALAHIRSGLEDCRGLSKTDPVEAASLELELLQKMAQPLIAVSGWSSPELEDLYARARALCRSTGSEDAEFEVDRGLYNMHLLRSDLRTADAIADRLLERTDQPSAAARRDSLLLIALRAKALPAFYAAAFAQARPLLEQTLAIYDAERHADHALHYGIEPAMLALSYLAWMDASDGGYEKAAARMQQALLRARAVGHAFSVCYALCFAASCAQLSNAPETAGRQADEALRLGNQHNFPYWIAWAKALQGWVRGLDSPKAGVALIEEALAGYRTSGSTLVAPYFEALACSIERGAGIASWQARESRLRAQAKKTGVCFWTVALEAGSRIGPLEQHEA